MLYCLLLFLTFIECDDDASVATKHMKTIMMAVADGDPHKITEEFCQKYPEYCSADDVD